jgi:hypothetical protein
LRPKQGDKVIRRVYYNPSYNSYVYESFSYYIRTVSGSYIFKGTFARKILGNLECAHQVAGYKLLYLLPSKWACGPKYA